MRKKIQRKAPPVSCTPSTHINTESYVRAILHKAERYTFGCLEDLLWSGLEHAALKLQGKKGKWAWFEEQVHELVSLREEVLRYPQDSLERLRPLAKYSAELMFLAHLSRS